MVEQWVMSTFIYSVEVGERQTSVNDFQIPNFVEVYKKLEKMLEIFSESLCPQASHPTSNWCWDEIKIFHLFYYSALFQVLRVKNKRYYYSSKEIMTMTNNRNQNNRLDLMAYIPSIQQFIHLIERRKFPRKDFTLKVLNSNRVAR